jgi:hypothetical protein
MLGVARGRLYTGGLMKPPLREKPVAGLPPALCGAPVVLKLCTMPLLPDVAEDIVGVVVFVSFIAGACY